MKRFLLTLIVAGLCSTSYASPIPDYITSSAGMTFGAFSNPAASGATLDVGEFGFISGNFLGIYDQVTISFATPVIAVGFDVGYALNPSTVVLNNGHIYTAPTVDWMEGGFSGIRDATPFTSATFNYAGSGYLYDFAYEAAGEGAPEPAAALLGMSALVALAAGRKMRNRSRQQ